MGIVRSTVGVAAGTAVAGSRLLVVMGHTHVPVRVEYPEGWVVNSGSCSVGQRMYVAIDTAARSVEIRRA